MILKTKVKSEDSKKQLLTVISHSKTPPITKLKEKQTKIIKEYLKLSLHLR